MKETTESTYRLKFFTKLMDATVYIIGGNDNVSEQEVGTIPCPPRRIFVEQGPTCPEV